MTTAQVDADRVLTPADVARLFHVSPGQVARWARSGKLPAFRTLGGHLRFRWSEVAPLLSTGQAPAGDDAEAVGA